MECKCENYVVSLYNKCKLQVVSIERDWLYRWRAPLKWVDRIDINSIICTSNHLIQSFRIYISVVSSFLLRDWSYKANNSRPHRSHKISFDLFTVQMTELRCDGAKNSTNCSVLFFYFFQDKKMTLINDQKPIKLIPRSSIYVNWLQVKSFCVVRINLYYKMKEKTRRAFN